MLIHHRGLMHGRRAASGPVIYSCNMTAGTGSSYVGYDDGTSVGVFGSLSAQPVPGHTLATIISGPSGFASVYFSTGAFSLLTGKSLWVNGVNRGFGDSSDWIDGGGFNTYLEWSSGFTAFSNGVTYTIEFKA